MAYRAIQKTKQFPQEYKSLRDKAKFAFIISSGLSIISNKLDMTMYVINT